VLVQALTRNPLAEPGLLGVNAGAACAVAIGLGLARSLPIAMMMLVSLVGALVSGLVVTGAAGAWRGRHDPGRIVLVGAAWSAVVSAITTVMLLSDPRIYAEFRFWDAGAVMPRPLDLVIAAAGTLGAGLLEHEPYRAVTLSEEGDRRARRMMRRHRLLETYLVEVLGFEWDEVHAEAEVLEHACSDRLLAALDAAQMSMQ